MPIVVIILVVLAVVVTVTAWRALSRDASDRYGGERGDAEAEATRWLDRLGAGVASLPGGTDVTARQALADAAERYSAGQSQLSRARTAAQFHLVTATALEGLYYLRAAREALGLDPGPELPAAAPTVSTETTLRVGDDEVGVGPRRTGRTPYYYPGGVADGRSVPAGWYARPWWRTALVAGAAGMGGALLLDGLLDLGHGPAGGFGGGPGGFGGGFGGGPGGFGGGPGGF